MANSVAATSLPQKKSYLRLTEWFQPWDEVIVAFSGGVDSTLVLQAACDGVGAARVLAVTAHSPSLANTELQACRRLAQEIGVKQQILQTRELENPSYRANLGNRCFFCKSTMYQSIIELLKAAAPTDQRPQSALVDGTNLDDLSDIRPGQKAARAAGVRHPLVELELSKADVRRLSQERGLPTWDKPEMACLASRIPAGIEVTTEKLTMIEHAEAELQQLGFCSYRVRYHELHSLRDKQQTAAPLTLARIELAEEEFDRAGDALTRETIARVVKEHGFSFVTIDLEGYRKGGRTAQEFVKVTLLGTGTSTGVPIPGCRCEVCDSDNPKNKRHRVSAYVELQGKDLKASALPADERVAGILIDTTPDLRTQALSHNLSKVDAVLYTHTHADHVFGIDDLRSFNFVNKTSIPIYASETSAEMLESTFNYCFFPDPDYQGGSPPQLTLTRIKANESFSLFDFEILPLAVEHGRMEVLGFRFGKFAYITDCSRIPPKSLEQLSGLEILVLDGLRHRPHPTHFSLQQAAEIAEQLDVKQTYLTHLSHEVEHEDGNKFLRGATTAQVELGYDGLVVELL